MNSLLVKRRFLSGSDAIRCWRSLRNPLMLPIWEFCGGRFASLISMSRRIGISFSLASALILLSRFQERPPASGCRMT